MGSNMGDRVSFLRNAAASMEAQGIRIEKGLPYMRPHRGV